MNMQMRRVMKPTAYMERLIGDPSDQAKQILTLPQFRDAEAVIHAGYRHIGRRVEEHYGDDMTPEAVQAAALLQGFLCVFLEYAANPALMRKHMRKLS